MTAEITELWVENSQKINCRDVTSTQEARVASYNNDRCDEPSDDFDIRVLN